MFVQIFAAIVLAILPGSWITYGLRLTGIPSAARIAMAIALSPAVVGLQLVILESMGVPFAESARLLVFLNLPCTILLARRHRNETAPEEAMPWLSLLPAIVLLVAIPVLIWSFIPGIRTYTWSSMLQTDIIYTIARDGIPVEEANLAGLSLAYGWIGHSFWSVIGSIGDWAPTTIYPFTNILWIIITFILSYQLGTTGVGLHRATALLGVVLMFLATNLIGIILFIVNGYSPGWERYFGDIRYSPFLSKFYAFDTMLWGMALVIALALVYTIALRKRVTPLDGLAAALLVSLGLIYPILFPAGLILTGGFIFLILFRLPKDIPQYTPGEYIRLGFAIVLSIIVFFIYLKLVTANREAVPFELTSRSYFRYESVRFLGALGPFMIMAVLPSIAYIRLRYGPGLLMVLSAMALSAVYLFIDLAQLEYKYVLAATVCLAFLAAAALDPLFRRQPRRSLAAGNIVVVSLTVINLLLVFKAGAHLPGNLAQGAPLDESSFWIALRPSNTDASWTKAIHAYTPENTVVIARVPGIDLPAVVGRSMYIPSDLKGGSVPGYNLGQRFYLLKQRGYPEKLYDQRVEVVKTLYTSKDETKTIEALHYLKKLGRPVAIHFRDRNKYSLRWLETHRQGNALFSDGQNTVWLIDDPRLLP